MSEEVKVEGTPEAGSEGWNNLELVDKKVFIVQLILDAANSARLGDYSLAVLVPEGAKEEFETLWGEEMRRSAEDESAHTPGTEAHSIYYPPVQEYKQAIVPALFKQSHQEEQLLRSWFNAKLKDSGVDTSKLMPVKMTTETLRGLYIVDSLLIEPSKKTASGLISTSGLRL